MLTKIRLLFAGYTYKTSDLERSGLRRSGDERSGLEGPGYERSGDERSGTLNILVPVENKLIYRYLSNCYLFSMPTKHSLLIPVEN
jgi:hypothetical protein